jgi:hypothetical protein
MPARQLLDHCEEDAVILHNDSDSVEADQFKTMPRKQWKSLQLIRCRKTRFYSTTWEGKSRWRVTIRHGANSLLDLGLTDPVVIDRLNKGEDISRDCILTISLAGPWSPDGIQPKRCYKLVAGVIEVP